MTYVAVTRPASKLVITYPATVRRYKDTIATQMSRFLAAAQTAKPGLFEFQDKTDPRKAYQTRRPNFNYGQRFRW